MSTLLTKALAFLLASLRNEVQIVYLSSLMESSGQ